ncbi:MAG: HD domain-containing protein, partial [Desulfobulbus sp.]|nr:HD domain-containing protein [Desulfobulbus sp.]
FSLLDFIYCHSFFWLFLGYRLGVVAILVFLLLLLRYPPARRYSQGVMWSAMLLGTIVITVMTVHLGGFTSGYYVGILLMIAGAFSVLPLTVLQSLILGSLMYLVYTGTVFLASSGHGAVSLPALANNSFFFFAIILITSVQCYDEIQITVKSLRAKASLRAILTELRLYTDNLEQLVCKRLEMLEESDLKFFDLYNALPDLVVLIDGKGVIRMVNRLGAAMLDQTVEQLEETVIFDYFFDTGPDVFIERVIDRINTEGAVRDVQLVMTTPRGRRLEVEITGNQIALPHADIHYHLVIRDITSTKKIEREVLKSSQLLDTSRQAAIFGLARLAECRDDSTGSHLLRIREYTRILAIELSGYPELKGVITTQFIEDLCLSSILHDIGKIGIPDAILLKPDHLSPEEYSIMQKHCLYGSEALTITDYREEEPGFLRMGQEIALNHHECWDGSGYPNGLSGIQIPLTARITALADVYDALTSSRAYKPAYNHEQARMYIVKESGRQFDPMVVNAFLKREQEFKAARRDLLLRTNPSSIKADPNGKP